MLLSYVGEEIFMSGVSIYLKTHKFGNSETSDLWKGIQQAIDTRNRTQAASGT
jgi:aminopeptidase 2